MKDFDFDKLCESIKQADEVKRGIRKSSRVYQSVTPDVKSIRERLGLSQSRFAALMGVSAR